MKIAIIGCGEVGRIFAKAAASRHEVILCDAYPSPAAESLAVALGSPLHRETGAWLAEADRVWSCVTGDAAFAAAASAVEWMTAGAQFVDLTTASPDDKRAAADLASKAGVGYADVAIMGAVAIAGIATPLLITGETAGSTAAELNEVGCSARAAIGDAGDAIALKLLRTVLTKGVEALAVEAFIAAEKRGVREELYRVLADIDEQGFTTFLNAVVRTHLLHAERRMHEVERAIKELRQEELSTHVLDGVLVRFEETVQALRTSPPAADASQHIDSSVRWLLTTSAEPGREPAAATGSRS